VGFGKERLENFLKVHEKESDKALLLFKIFHPNF